MKATTKQHIKKQHSSRGGQRTTIVVKCDVMHLDSLMLLALMDILFAHSRVCTWWAPNV